MSNDLHTHELSKLTNDGIFAAIEEFCEAQPVEGWRHDFTEQWDDSAIEKVAAFANTFGGLLIVGVKKGKRDPKCDLIGVQSKDEYKTRIASSIATNLSPTPPYEIFECHHPREAQKKYCVVRVRQSKAFHLITKKSIKNPAYIRNEDEARPADAGQLRRLIDREKEDPVRSQERIRKKVESLRDSLCVRQEYSDPSSDRWYLSASKGSSAFLRLVLVPIEDFSFDFEASKEEQFQSLVLSVYPRIRATQDRVALETEFRGTDFYEYVWFHTNNHYEMRWRITADGGIGSSSQMRTPDLKSTWSVVDLAERVFLFYKLTVQWWEKNGYFGEGQVHAQLSLDNLELSRTGTYGFYPGGMIMSQVGFPPVSISGEAIWPTLSPRNAANAELNVSYFSLGGTVLRSTMLLLNSMLRGLGHGVVWNKLEQSIKPLIQG